MSQQDIDIIQSKEGLATDVRRMIEETRERVAQTVNAGITLLYWHIGKRIQTEILNNERAEYGKEIVHSLSAQLTNEFGKNFGDKNLRRMLQFAEIFPEGPIVATLSRQLGWSHFKELIPLNRSLSL